jgi:hypothetical protein
MSFIVGPGYVGLPRTGGAWIIQDLLPIGGLLNIFGQPKKGKSYLALQMAQAIANPAIADVLGFPIRTHGPVAYLQIDTPRGLWAERVEALGAAGLSFDGVYFADSELVPYPFNILGEGFGWLQQNLKMIAPFPLTIVVDTIREAHAGDENDSGHMRNVVNLLVEAVRPASIILLSHARKEWGEGTGDLMSDNRGSSYVAGRMDCVLKVNENSVQFQGRTVGEARIQIKRSDDGLFVLSDDFTAAARDIVATTPGDTPTMTRVRMLQEKYPKKSAEAIRSMIRRIEKSIPEGLQGKAPARRIDLDDADTQPTNP